MCREKLLFIGLLFTASFASAQSTQVIGTTTVTIDTLTTNVTVPWEIKVQDDYLWVTERPGRVSHVDLATGNKTVVLDLTSTVHAVSESGLLGMALHPDFATTPEVFLVYTYGPEDNDGYFKERMVKYTFDGTNLINPQILIDDILAWSNHNGSRLHILPDNTILMSTGECYVAELAQDSTSLSGKYLRINMDGSVPSDNPIPGSYVFSMGHRNSQGICALPGGKILISEHGPTTDDELQILEMGKNYGWPLIHGFCDESFEDDPCATGLYQEPIRAWTPTIATSDLVFYENWSFPEWHNRVLMVTLNGQRLVAMQLDGTASSVTDEDQYFTSQFGRLRDIAIGPDREIYIATNTGAGGQHPILRITPPYAVGIDEAHQASVSIVPNPAMDVLQLTFEGTSQPVAVLDLNGRTIMDWKNVTSGEQIDIRLLAPGTYLVEVAGKREKFVKL